MYTVPDNSPTRRQPHSHEMHSSTAQVLQWIETLPMPSPKSSPPSEVAPSTSTGTTTQEGATVPGGPASALLPPAQHHDASKITNRPRLRSSISSPSSLSLSMTTPNANGAPPGEFEPDSAFLALPPELRNDIYCYALLRHDKIKISVHMARPPPEPAILRVNRQTRQEALGFYYRGNHFRFDMHNFNASAYNNWVRAQPVVRSQLQIWFKLYAVTSPDLAWTNLMDWLEAIHGQRVFHGPSSRAFPGKKKHRVVAGELKELAASMARQGMSWNNVLACLSYSKRMLAASSADGMWL